MSAEIDLLRAEVSMLKYRALSAELALYQVGDALRQQSKHADDIVRHIHELDRRFPLGDRDSDGMERITINAIKASVPGAAGMTDDEVRTKYLTPVKEPT